MTTLLLDTSVVLWWTTSSPRIPDSIGREIRNPSNVIMVSAATAWEVGIKQAKGKLRVDADFVESVERGGMRWIPIGATVATKAASLPAHHNDPFDRLLVAQAIHDGSRLVTPDRTIRAYDVDVLWT